MTPAKERPSEINQRHLMVEYQLRRQGIHDERVLKIMARVPRHLFIDPPNQNQAYADHPVSIGQGQTISQPYIVGLMTEKLDVQPEHHVLEVGTGCGYQTAILAQLAQRVYSIELLEELSRPGRTNVEALGISNVVYCIGNGRNGWPREHTAQPTDGHFDRILVAAATETIPPALLEQLTDGGKIVIPLGTLETQKLILGQKQKSTIKETLLCYCRFVELK
jgi:protein-L-isoaspartate(D-aspartate) O-methyltransferase